MFAQAVRKCIVAGSLIFAYAETQDLPQPTKENPLQITQIAD